MNRVIVPNKKQWDILRDLGLTSPKGEFGDNVFLIRPDIAKGLNEDELETMAENCPTDNCELAIQLVTSRNNIFFDQNSD